MRRLFDILSNLYIFTLINGMMSVLTGVIGSGLICALLLGLDTITRGGVVVYDLQRTFTTIALVIGGLVALFSIYEYRDMWITNRDLSKTT
jgi:hypothetical protein